MFRVTIRFYAELNDFLPPEKKQVPISCSFELPLSIKHLIESIGAVHTEVDLILVNGEPVDFSYLVQDGDQISVYPVFESLDITPLIRLRPEPLRQPRFILDIHLGRLAAYLRMLGFDTLYRNDYDDEELARISSSQSRILLTRDRGLLKRSLVTRGYCVRSSDPLEQASEVLKRFDLTQAVKPFQRCLRCNGLLRSVEKETVGALLQHDTGRYYNEFQRCEECGQIYWKGSHVRHMINLIETIISSINPGS
jgi:uncharacterized protein